MENLRTLISKGRERLPRAHRVILAEIGVQEAIIDGWPGEVTALYETLREAAPAVEEIAGAVAVWLDEGRRPD